jgi:Rieske Fe-S protein
MKYKDAMIRRSHVSRRSLMQAGATFAAVSLCDGCRMFGSRKADVRVGQKGGEIRLSPEQSAELLRDEGSLLIQSPDVAGKILAVHAGDDRLYAVNSVCTHRGCDVLYDRDLGHIRCPCHGSQYGLDGHNIRGPARQPLASYKIHVSEGQVVIRV